jgi:hypothetical protein
MKYYLEGKTKQGDWREYLQRWSEDEIQKDLAKYNRLFPRGSHRITKQSAPDAPKEIILQVRA